MVKTDFENSGRMFESFGFSNSDHADGRSPVSPEPRRPALRLPSHSHSFILSKVQVASAMDPDRKSHISSYYGGRQSGDALNNDYSGNPAQPQRTRQDSASSYYNQDVSQPRPSTEFLNGGTRSAGYNQNSFFDVGRTEPLKGGIDEEDPLRGKTDGSWDVFADFNNAGPRYSTAYVDPEPV